jgi:5'-nucleotidase
VQIRRSAALPMMTLTVAAALAGCSSAGSGASGPATTAVSGAARASESPAAPAALSIVVTNDDGYSSPGINTLVTALRAMPAVTVTVVAPAKNQSGTGGKTTSGTVTYQAAKTASGYPATAVNGYPADTISVALDQLHLHPGLVVSGINQGQNLGPVTNLSGTVGAAKAAVSHGIPALAVSSGSGATQDYAEAATLAVSWVKQHRGALTTTAVANMNVPSCASGAVRGLKELPTQSSIPDISQALAKQDCTSTANPTTEVAAFNDGFATLTAVPA